MTLSKNRSFSRLASNINDQGDITSAGIATDVSLGATVYDSIGDLPYSEVNEGQTALIPDTGRFYVYSGQGWYNVAVINRTPTITVQDSDGNTDPFGLAIDRTPTNITLVTNDSDGDPLSYSYVADSNFAKLATITGSGTSYTITPLSEDSTTASEATITFKATDGINIASAITSISAPFAGFIGDFSGSTLVGTYSGASPISANGTGADIGVYQGSRAVYTNTSSNSATIVVPSIVNGDAFTVEFYAYTLGTPDAYWDAFISITSGSKQFIVYQVNDNTHNFYDDEGYAGVALTVNSNGAWKHYAYTFHPTNDSKFFLNGTHPFSVTWDPIFNGNGDPISINLGSHRTYFTDIIVTKDVKYDAPFTPPSRTTV